MGSSQEELSQSASVRWLMRSRLPRDFFARDHVTVAKDLIGKLLWRASEEGLTVVKIVETEAYGGADDPGSHGYRGMTRRNATMFGPPGRAYVYFTYGMHHCLNVVTGDDGQCSAVLIRAGEPIAGIWLMYDRRGVDDLYDLTSGPARLAQAMAIDRSMDGADLCDSEIGISAAAPSGCASGDDGETEAARVVAAPRVGLSRDGGQLWRFCLEGCRFVSRPRPWSRRASPGSGASATRRNSGSG